MNILGIESSCDETAAAIVADGKTIITNVVASSALMHRKYGGIVPEVAARKQIESIIPVLTEAMAGLTKDDIDAIAITVGPGLIGSLLVGIETAKTLAFLWGKPLIPVNHVHAHMYASFLENNPPHFPALSLVVSGGHTELYLVTDEKTLAWLGGTLDDAAGECFDKCARLLGLAYPGGPEIAKAAVKYSSSERSESRSSLSKSFVSSRHRSNNITLPRPMINDKSFNFSFSGLKTAVLREWKKYESPPIRHSGKPEGRIQNLKPAGSWTSQDDGLISAFAYEIQESITDVLVAKALNSAKEYNVSSIIVSGGVAANKRLKQKLELAVAQLNPPVSVHVPSPSLCVDSGASIAAYAYYHNHPQTWAKITAIPDLKVD